MIYIASAEGLLGNRLFFFSLSLSLPPHSLESTQGVCMAVEMNDKAQAKNHKIASAYLTLEPHEQQAPCV